MLHYSYIKTIDDIGFTGTCMGAWLSTLICHNTAFEETT